ncbi:MAG TPA: plastocyanin/azurin family copper-binding protein [Solirubrobacterales bacterium]
MTRQMRGVTGVATSLAIAGVLLAGCGGGDDNTTTVTEPEGSAGAAAGGSKSATVEIKMGDFFFDPKNAMAKSGQTTIEAPNDGSVEHELVLFKTNANPAKLPTDASGSVDEEKLDQQAQEIGEVADVEAGETKSGTFKLTPGNYVMFCNLPGHYAQGMYGTVTVTK